MKRRTFLLTVAVLFHLAGSWLPTPALAELDWIIQTVDIEGDVGQYSSLALDATGNPHISYYDATNHDLKYASFGGSAWGIQVVDFEGDVGEYTSLALDSDGNPRIGYYDVGNHDLKYAAYQGSAWDIQTIDSYADAGRYTSLALDADGAPHISYYEPQELIDYGGNLKYATLNGSQWDVQVVDSGKGIGSFTSIALDGGGDPHISYHRSETRPWQPEPPWEPHLLKYAAFDGSTWETRTVDSDGIVGWWTSLALDAGDSPHISYHDYANGDLKYATSNGRSWDIQTVDMYGNVGRYTSLALDSSDNPHISYFDYTNGDLKYAVLDGSVWDIQTIDSDGEVGWWTSLALDADGNPHISYYDITNGDLKYAFAPEPATLLLLGLGAVIVRRRAALRKR